MRFGRSELVALAFIVAASEVRAGDNPPGDYYSQLAATVKAKLDALVAARAPKLVPPVPIKPAWKVAKVGSIDLGAPLVALAAAELDGDPKSAELYAVTPRELIAIGYKSGKLIELGRTRFTG
ncbi:MAG: hypothetical protein H0V17_01550, partial [Deltaproteobacteria bacterium]|nr:hypothetical protein [Deltaproteobacteria bacterium]